MKAGLPQLVLLRRGMPCSQQCWGAQHQSGGIHYCQHGTPVILGAGDSHPEAPRQRKPHAQCRTGRPIPPSVPTALPAIHGSQGGGSLTGS